MFISATSVLAAAVVFNAASTFAAVVPITDSSAVAREVTPEVEIREAPADLLVAAREQQDSNLQARNWHKKHAHKAQEPAPLVHDAAHLQHTQAKFLVTGRVKKWHRVHKWKHVHDAVFKACNKNKNNKKAHDKKNHHAKNHAKEQQLIVTMFKYNMPGKSYAVTNQQQWEKVLKAAKGHPILVSAVNPATNPVNNNKKATPAKPKGKRDLEEDDVLARDFEDDVEARDFEEDMDMFARDFEDDEDMFAREFDDDVYVRSFESIADLD